MILLLVKKVFILLYIYVVFLMIKRIYVNDIIKKKIYGSDKYMSQFKVCHAGGIFYFTCSLELMKDYVKKTKQNLIDYIKDKKDIFRYFDFKNKKICINNKLTIDDLLFECDNDIYDIINKKKINNNMGLFFTYSYKRKNLGLFFDHSIYDLSTAFKFFNLIYTHPFNEIIKKIPDYKYKPLLNELLTFKSYNFLKFKNYLPQIKNMYKNNLLIKSYEKEKTILIKNKFNLKSVDISLAISLDHIFKSIDTKYKKLTVGILFSFKNTRFNNNYTIIPITIKKDNLFNIAKQIKKEKKKNYIYSLLIYDYFNYYLPDIQQKLKKNNFDVFFSNVYTNNEEFYKYFKTCSFHVNSTCNFYITSSSSKLDKYNYISYEYKNNIVNKEKFNQPILINI